MYFTTQKAKKRKKYLNLKIDILLYYKYFIISGKCEICKCFSVRSIYDLKAKNARKIWKSITCGPNNVMNTQNCKRHLRSPFCGHTGLLLAAPVWLGEGLCSEPPPWTCVLFSSAVTSYSFRRRRRAPWVSLGNEESTFFSWSQLKEQINQMWTNLQACSSVFLCRFLGLGIQPTLVRSR